MEKYDDDCDGELDKQDILRMLAPLKIPSLDARKESVFKSSCDLKIRKSFRGSITGSMSLQKSQNIDQDDNTSTCSAMLIPDIREKLAKKEHEKNREKILLNFADVLLNDFKLDSVKAKKIDSIVAKNSPRNKIDQFEIDSNHFLKATSQYVMKSNIPVRSIMNVDSILSSLSDSQDRQTSKK